MKPVLHRRRLATRTERMLVGLAELSVGLGGCEAGEPDPEVCSR
jgi:hypothetical protein